MKKLFYFLGAGIFAVIGIFTVLFVGNIVRGMFPSTHVIGEGPLSKIPGLYHQKGQDSQTVTQSNAGLSVTAKLGSNAIDDTGYLMIKLAADKNSEPLERYREPLNLAIVVDRSGSMSGEKLQSVKQALINVAKLLTPHDRLTLVVYDDNVNIEYSGYYDEEKFERIVWQIESGGSTNLASGLRQGLQAVSNNLFDDIGSMEHSSRERLKTADHVILLSDGRANVGMSTPQQLSSLVEQQKGSNVTVSTIGVGSDYDENVMTAIAIAGNGKYYFMESATQAQDIFTQEIASLQATVFRDMHVDIQLKPDFSVTQGIGYKALSGSSFEPHDLSAGSDASYVFELHHMSDKEGKAELGKVIVSYYDVTTKNHEKLELPLEVEARRGDVNPLSDDEVYQEFMRSYLAEKLWEVDQHLNEVNNDQALQVLNEVEVDLKAASQRVPTAFSSDLDSVHQKQDYLKIQGERSVMLDVAGRNFKKLNQAESFDVQYNR